MPMRGWIIAAVTTIIVSTVAGVVAISIFADKTESISQIIAMVVPTLAALSALLSSAINSRKIDENIVKTEESISKTEENIVKTEEVHKVVVNGNGDTKH